MSTNQIIYLLDPDFAYGRQLQKSLQSMGVNIEYFVDPDMFIENFKKRLEYKHYVIICGKKDFHNLCIQIKEEVGIDQLDLLFTSSMTEPEEIIQGLELGADGFVAKPYIASEVIGLIDILSTYNTVDNTADKVNFSLRGKDYSITFKKSKILELLISSYFIAIQRNKTVSDIQSKLAEAGKQVNDSSIIENSQIENSISELIKTQNKLISKKDTFAFLLENSSDAFFCLLCDEGIPIDINTKEQLKLIYERMYIVEYNQSLVTQLGFERDFSLQNLGVSKLLPLLSIENQSFLYSFIESGYQGFDFISKSYDDELQIIEFSNSWIGVIEKNCLKRIWGIRRDINMARKAQKLNTEMLRRIDVTSRAAGVGIWEINLTTYFLYCSEIWRSQLGIDADVKLNIGKWRLLIHPEDIFLFEEMLSVMESEQKRDVTFDYRVLHSDGQYRWMYLTAVYHEKDEKGNSKIYGTHQDISARKNTESELKQLIVKAEEANMLKTEFINNISHEMRTPMNSIMGYSSLLMDEEPGQTKMIEYSRRINRSSRNLLQIVDDMLLLSMLNTRQLKPNIKSINTYECLQMALSHFIDELNDKSAISLEIISFDKTLEVNSDIDLLLQILQRIISNAIKFTDKGKIVIGIEERGSNVIFRVEDSGVGMSEKQLECLGEPFRKFTYDQEFFNRGTGLGLNISRAISSLIGVELKFSSVPGKGTCVEIVIPDK